MTEEGVTEEKRAVPRMSEDEIAETVKGLVAGRIFTASMCPPDMIPSVFMVVGLGGLAGLDLEDVGNIIEHMDKAGPRSVNGYPMFFSCQVVHTDDWKVIAERAIKAQEALDKAAQG